MQLPDDVKAEAMAMIESQDTMRATEQQAARLNAELHRLNRIYQAGNISDDYYDRH
jgi:hypothetical protein